MELESAACHEFVDLNEFLKSFAYARAPQTRCPGDWVVLKIANAISLSTVCAPLAAH